MSDQTVFLITHIRFWRRRHGSQIRLDDLVKWWVGRNWKVSLLFLGTLTAQEVDTMKASTSGVELRTVGPRGIHKELLPAVTGRMRDRVARYFAPETPSNLEEFKTTVFREMCEVAPSIVWMVHLHLAPILTMLPESAKKNRRFYLDTLDVQYLRTLRFKRQGIHDHLSMSKQREARLLSPFDGVVAIQNEEADCFRQMVPAENVLTVGMCYPIHRPNPVSSRRVRLLYAAGQGDANKKSLESFFTYCWPKVAQTPHEDIQLNVYGDVCKNFKQELLPEGVFLHGFVNSLERAYREADIVINPVVAGTGLKIKNMEAMCFSKPLISMMDGSQGLEDGIGHAFLACDTWADFAENLLEVIRSPEKREQLAEGAYLYAMSHFSEEAAYREIGTVFPSLETKTPSG